MGWKELEGVKNQEFTRTGGKEKDGRDWLVQSKVGGRDEMKEGIHTLLWEFQNPEILEVTNLDVVALSST